MFLKRSIQRKANKLFDAAGFEFNTAQIISGVSCKKDGLYLKGQKIAEAENGYYCAYNDECDSDDYHGFVFFKTLIPGRFVQVHFAV